MGIKIVKTEGGKTDWPFIRRVFYVALVVWVVAVRVFNVDPFGLAALYVVAWVMDLLAIIAIWLFVWHVMWPNRPALGNSTN